MVHLKATIFILSLVLLEAANGQPTRFANLKEDDRNTETLPSDMKKEGPDALLVRLKRGSDQRLAELETLYGLSKINPITTTNRPIYKKINPVVIGRRRRSTSNSKIHGAQRIGQRSSESTINEILIS